MARAFYIGEWRIWQDSPDYGCTDNPSYEWFARQVSDGHMRGEALRFPTEHEMRKHFSEVTSGGVETCKR